MAGSVNRVVLVGRVGKDPEIRTLNSGDKVANFTLATSETWRDRQSGERKEKTEWHRVSVFNENIAKVVEQYVRKGALLYVEGSLQTRKWTDQSGVEKYATEIVLQKFRGELTMLGGKSDQDDEGGQPSRSRSDDRGGYGSASGAGYDAGSLRGSGGKLQQTGPKQNFDLDDPENEIPF